MSSLFLDSKKLSTNASSPVRQVTGPQFIPNIDKYYDSILTAAARRESIFQHCPLNVEGGARFRPQHPIDWRSVAWAPTKEISSDCDHLVDLAILDKYPQVQREQGLLCILEFVYCVYDVKYIPTQDESAGHVMTAFTLRSVAETPADFVDYKYTYGENISDKTLEICKELCDGSYTSMKSSERFNGSQHDIEMIPIAKSSLLDHIHTLSAVVDALEKKTELTIIEEDDFIPYGFKDHPPLVYSKEAPPVYNWKMRMEKVVQRLRILRNCSKAAFIAFLLGKKASFSS